MLDDRSVRRARWMERVQDGDGDAYRALLDDIRPALLAFLQRRVADPHAVEDIYQETLIAMHRARHTYDPARPLEPWLFAIARNVAVDHNRRDLARLSRELLLETPPEAAAAWEAGDGRLTEALGRLPPAQREAFEMLKIEGLSVAAGAARARISEGALRVRAHRAYKAIRAFLRGEGS